jgi:glycosyltransferase involved in cell wall biosynthesis
MTKGLVSIIIPCYNAEEFVEESLNTMINQTYKDLEIICVDDASTDRTGEILENLAKKDPRIICIHHKKNLKIVETLNRTLPLARGEYIARMDADDLCPLDRIEKQVKFLQNNPHVDIVGSWAVKFGGSTRKWQSPTSHEGIIEELFIGSPIPHSVVMFRRSVLPDVHYDKDYLYVEDYKLWFELSKKYKLANIPEYLLYYRIYPLQSSYRNAIQEENLRKLKLEIINYYLTINHIPISIHTFEGYKTIKKILPFRRFLPKNIYNMIKTSIYLNSSSSFLNFLFFIFNFDFLKLRKRYVISIMVKFIKN